MPALLAIETSTTACSVALRHFQPDGTWLDSHLQSELPRTHSATLLELIEQLLADAGLQRRDLCAVSIGNGPGSFTGLRIGLAVAQGIALGLDIPLLPISSLAVLAASAQQHSGSAAGQPLLAVTDARMGQYNVGCFTLAEQGVEPATLEPPRLASAADLQSICERYGAPVVAGELATLASLAPLASAFCELQPRADALLAIAAEHYRQGGWPPRDRVELVYLRGTEAWQKHQPIVPKAPAQ